MKRQPTIRKYIAPGSVRIYGLPGTDRDFGVRDNGSGQMWSKTRKVGSINYWTGEVFLTKEHVPNVRVWDELLILLGLKTAELPNVRYEYEVVDLKTEATVTELHTTEVEGARTLEYTGAYRRRLLAKYSNSSRSAIS